MHSEELIERIAEKDFDVDAFVRLAISDSTVREEIVHQMLTHKHIMVYYHCYYVIEKASREKPELFYPYWDGIVDLLNHKNSYHRDFGLDIIGNLTAVDQEDRFSQVAETYFGLVNDEKFMTGNCCVRNLLKIYRHKYNRREEIIALLLDIDDRCSYTEKRVGVLKSDVLAIFDEVYDDVKDKAVVNAFIKRELNSVSPKTKKKAKVLVRKYNL